MLDFKDKNGNQKQTLTGSSLDEVALLEMTEKEKAASFK